MGYALCSGMQILVFGMQEKQFQHDFGIDKISALGALSIQADIPPTSQSCPHSQGCHDDDPVTSQSCQEDVPPTSQSCQEDVPPTSQSCQDDVSPTSQSCQDDVPPTSQSCVDEVPPTSQSCPESLLRSSGKKMHSVFFAPPQLQNRIQRYQPAPMFTN